MGKYYQYEVFHIGLDKWIRVGRGYATKEVAKSWRSFIKAGWNGAPVRLRTFTLNTLPDAPIGRAAVAGTSAAAQEAGK